MRGPAPLHVAALLLLCAHPAGAHLSQLRGRLVELVQHSDAIVIGAAEVVQAHGRRFESTIRIEQTLAGAAPSPLTFTGAVGYAPRQRYVFFLQRRGDAWESAAPSGTVFPAAPADDAMYRATIGALRQALAAGGAGALRAALIPALSADSAPLRYHAALDLMAHTPAPEELSAAQRETLQRLLENPAADPALRPLLAALLQSPAH